MHHKVTIFSFFYFHKTQTHLEVPFRLQLREAFSELLRKIVGDGEFEIRLSVRKKRAKSLLVHLFRPIIRWQHPKKRGSATNQKLHRPGYLRYAHSPLAMRGTENNIKCEGKPQCRSWPWRTRRRVFVSLDIETGWQYDA